MMVDAIVEDPAAPIFTTAALTMGATSSSSGTTPKPTQGYSTRAHLPIRHRPGRAVHNPEHHEHLSLGGRRLRAGLFRDAGEIMISLHDQHGLGRGAWWLTFAPDIADRRRGSAAADTPALGKTGAPNRIEGGCCLRLGFRAWPGGAGTW